MLYELYYKTMLKYLIKRKKCTYQCKTDVQIVNQTNVLVYADYLKKNQSTANICPW